MCRKFTIYGDYMAAEGNGVKRVTGILDDAEITVFHRTFSRMVEEILASGFTIEKMVEPQPTEGMKEADPAIYEQLKRIPTFMVWVLKK